MNTLKLVFIYSPMLIRPKTTSNDRTACTVAFFASNIFCGMLDIEGKLGSKHFVASLRERQPAVNLESLTSTVNTCTRHRAY